MRRAFIAIILVCACTSKNDTGPPPYNPDCTDVPDQGFADKVRRTVESDGDRVVDLHLWRLGPGHLGAIVAVATTTARDAAHYRERLAKFADLSHVTIEVQRSRPAG